jgi:hypothetical protein
MHRYNETMRLTPALMMLLLLSAAVGQEQNSKSSSPELADAPAIAAPAPPQHRFWDRENILLFSGVAVFRGMDFASTKNFLARGRSEVLIPDDIVNNSARFASLEAAATMTSVGISYIFHRAGHHKMERWVSIIHISATGFGVVRNYSLKSKHPN